MPPIAALTTSLRDRTQVLTLSGRLDADGVADIWDAALALARDGQGALVLDAAKVSYLAGPGVALILELTRIARQAGRTIDVAGLPTRFQDLLEPERTERLLAEPTAPRSPRFTLPLEVGRAVARLFDDLAHQTTFVGEFASALVWAALHPRRVRWRDALAVAETAGVNALPIIILIGFLMGLIMSFQSAVPLKQFGAEIYVGKLLVISMTRELGPLVTAIILAGRSGSAFAAEIGTMSVNEELNALETMGLSPVRFLVVTRVLAAMAMTPILTVFFNLAALVGGALVMRTFGYPLVTYLNQLSTSASVGDIIGGLFKATVFGLLVCAIGCQRGLRASGGPSAVGDATTSAVVSGITLIAMSDGIFAVVFYALKL